MAQGIARRMHLTAPCALPPSHPARGLLSGVECRVRLSKIAAEDCPVSFCQPRHGQVLYHGLKHVGAQPTPHLVIDGFPRWQVIRHHAPWRTRSRDPAHAIEDFAQRMVPLRSVLGHEGHVGGDQGPCFIIDTIGVGFAFHPSRVSSP
jgi:hypothetical protein